MFGYRRLVVLIILAALAALSVAAPTSVAAASRGTRSIAAAGAAAGMFSCTDKSGGAVTGPPSPVRAVLVRSNHRFDRFVIKLAGPLQQWDVRSQSSATFEQDPSGLPVTLLGTAGLRVVVMGAQAHGFGFQVPTDIKPGFPVLLEARQIGDFEGVVSWGLGLSHPACFRVLATGRMLIVDVVH